jgi:hypothetical protein
LSPADLPGKVGHVCDGSFDLPGVVGKNADRRWDIPLLEIGSLGRFARMNSRKRNTFDAGDLIGRFAKMADTL